MTDLAERKETTAPGLVQEAVKKALDIAVASVLIVIMAPLLLLLRCLVRWTSAPSATIATSWTHGFPGAALAPTC